MLLAIAAASVGAATPKDPASTALDILPPGQGPNLPTLTTQEAMYDGLTPLQGNVTAQDLRTSYKPETTRRAVDVRDVEAVAVDRHTREHGVRRRLGDRRRPTYGSVHRVQLLTSRVTPLKQATPAAVVSAMNDAATKDLRQTLVPPLARVLAKLPPPTQRAAQALQTLQGWNGSRLDANGDGKIDAPGAALMDAWWPKLAVAVLQPVLGPLTDELQKLNPISDDASSQGSSYGSGWYEYVDMDLRSLLGEPLRGAFSTHDCGNGDVNACAATLWQTLDDAAAAAPAPADANRERISFGAFLADTMRWTNRPTFQQVVQFQAHR